MAKDKRTSVYFDRESLTFVGLDAAVKKQLKTSYKGIDVDTELSKMCMWLTSSKGSKRKGDISFIMNWLSRASPSAKEFIEPASPLDALLQEYLQGLWKGREHILELNTIQR